MGWILLNNEHTLLHRGNDSIALIGVENEGEPPFSQHGDLTKAQAGTNGLFKLLLAITLPTGGAKCYLNRTSI